LSRNPNGASGGEPPTPITTDTSRSHLTNRILASLPGTGLTSGDYQKLERSGISRCMAEQALLRRVDSFTGTEIVGRNGTADYAGIIIPYIWPGEQRIREYRLRRDHHEVENGKPKNKYISPPGRGNMLYFVPGTQPEWLANPNIPIMLTEGEKKTIALSELAWYAVGDAADTPAWLAAGISGVSNWRGKRGKVEGPNGERLDETGPIPDFDRVHWEHRAVTVIFDSNVHSNDNVRIARFALAKELRSRGARVLFLDIPANAGVNGIDDLIGLWGKDRILDFIRFQSFDPQRHRTEGPFKIKDDGVFWLKQTPDQDVKYVKLSARIDVVAKTEDAAGGSCGRLLRWKDESGRQHEWVMPMGMLASDSVAIREHLLSEGLPYLATNRALRERFSEYLQTAQVDERRVYVNRIGWHGNTYVLPHHSVAPDGAETVRYQAPGDAEHHWAVSGTTEDWRVQIGELCRGNSRLLLAGSCAFAGPVLALSGGESGGLHFKGGSSSGKSTALRVGASICGAPEFVQNWKNTKNGLEATAVAHNDATLFLDELHQLDAHDASEIAYDLANGQGRGRMSRSIAARPRLRWRLLFLSSGEISLSEHSASAGTKTKGGVDVRLLNIPSDAGADMGLFEDLHGWPSAAAFADELCNRTQSYYGAAFLSFLRKLIAKRAESERAIRAVRRKFLKCLPADAVGEVKRAAGRLALIAAAGELATTFGLTGWEKGEAFNAARRCYQDWVKHRGTTGPIDLYNAVRQVRAFLERHGSSRFQLLRGNPADDDTIVHDRAGFRRLNQNTGETEFLILQETFKSELCKGFSYLDVINELERSGLARCQRPSTTIKTRLPGFKDDVRVFCVRAAILEGDGTC
jgi:putative DNA primase/helicase